MVKLVEWLSKKLIKCLIALRNSLSKNSSNFTVYRKIQQYNCIIMIICSLDIIYAHLVFESVEPLTLTSSFRDIRVCCRQSALPVSRNLPLRTMSQQIHWLMWHASYSQRRPQSGLCPVSIRCIFHSFRSLVIEISGMDRIFYKVQQQSPALPLT